MQAQTSIANDKQLITDLLNHLQALTLRDKVEAEVITGRDSSQTVRVIFVSITDADEFVNNLFHQKIGSTTHGSLSKKMAQVHGQNWAVYVTVDQAKAYLSHVQAAIQLNTSGSTSPTLARPHSPSALNTSVRSETPLSLSPQFSPRVSSQATPQKPSMQLTDMIKNIVAIHVQNISGVQATVSCEMTEGHDRVPCLRVIFDSEQDAQLLAVELFNAQIGSTTHGATQMKKIQYHNLKQYAIYIRADQVQEYMLAAGLDKALILAERVKLANCVYMPHTLDELLQGIPSDVQALDYACEHFLGQWCLADDKQTTRLILLKDLQQKNQPLDYRAAQVNKVEECIASGNAAVKVFERAVHPTDANFSDSMLFRILLHLTQPPVTGTTKTHMTRSGSWSPRMRHSGFPAVKSMLSKLFAVTVLPTDTYKTQLFQQFYCLGFIFDMRRADVVRDDSTPLKGCEETVMKIRHCGVDGLFTRVNGISDRLSLLSAMYQTKKLFGLDFDLPLYLMPQGASHKHYDISMQCDDILAAIGRKKSLEQAIISQGSVEYNNNGSDDYADFTFTYDKTPLFVVREFIQANLNFLTQSRIDALKIVFAHDRNVSDLLNTKIGNNVPLGK